MESLERFTQNQLIIEEYVSQWLAPIPSEFGRLADVATLRDVTSGHYHHPALEEVYPESAVHQALLYCHEELFESRWKAATSSGVGFAHAFRPNGCSGCRNCLSLARNRTFSFLRSYGYGATPARSVSLEHTRGPRSSRPGKNSSGSHRLEQPACKSLQPTPPTVAEAPRNLLP
jgi:hypothetical protein